MLLVKAWVGRSQIHGLGLIAHEFIPKGTVLWRLTPGFDIILTEQELMNLSESAKLHMDHYGFFDADLNRYVLCGDDDRFTNHSDDANTRFEGDHAVAVRDIGIGEEITDDYTSFGKLMKEQPREVALDLV